MKFFALAAAIGVASSHTIFTQLTSGGVTNGIGVGIRDPTYDGPITDVTSNPIACNGGPNPTTASSAIINVAAGSSVKAIWRHTQTSGSNDVIDPSHKGPVMAYLKKVSSATSDPGTGSGWFKISAAGLNVATGKWATDDLVGLQSDLWGSGIDSSRLRLLVNKQFLYPPASHQASTSSALNSSRCTAVCLSPIKPVYMILIPTLASSSGGAQFYVRPPRFLQAFLTYKLQMECAQINITGGTGAKSPATVSFPGAYKATDPGILINIYNTLTGYTIPGPAVFTC
ncbi:putative endo-beta-1,4-glucanase D [Lachnellula suecica]|uniref:AA9 family lytic polysaccharide monooxygenase n=1 Tax=Lachnellula suecica TaxID=602035 RepID=A0A8T9CDT5_9HELO|nr:putative endo-beta-1,4-glucanase D [Lachnellula suecica]